MKLSLAWIFDHIKANLKDVDVDNLLAQFSATTAEIESICHLNLDPNKIFIVKPTQISSQQVKAQNFELNKKITLPIRADIFADKYYFIINSGKNYTWANLSDFGADKEGLMPAIYCPEDELKGSWKAKIEFHDTILEIDNKAVTNRPDLWGHRGFAREIAAIIKKPLISEESLLEAKPIKHYTYGAPANGTNIFGIEISQTQESCSNGAKRLAGIYLDHIDNKDSIVKIATRLARINSRPINSVVDITNYVMFDIGQPMHAFDASKIQGNKIIAQCARSGESLILLDGDKIELLATDTVVADASGPIALAGIMGGESTAVDSTTKTLFIESGNFDATVIRKSAFAHKKRTESSARFEKSLDPNQNTNAILRYLKILDFNNISHKAADAVLSVGPLSQEVIILVKHGAISAKIGVSIDSSQIEQILTNIGFGFQEQSIGDEIFYKVTVPTYRATKDILYPEDIVEEIARFIGYSSVVAQAPTRAMVPFNMRAIERTRLIKHQLAYGLEMHEVQTYSFFDEEFLQSINYQPKDYLEVPSPQSQNYRRLVTSLVPNLLKCVYTNHTKRMSLSFFELNRVWFLKSDNELIKSPSDAVESKELSGIFYEQKNELNFYDCKSKLEKLLNALNIDIEWAKPTFELEPWFNKFQTAQLLYNGEIIGRAGKFNKQMLNLILPGEAFIFELDANKLINISGKPVKFKPLHKYQETTLDISMLVPHAVTVQDLVKAVNGSDKLISNAHLIDIFEKNEWQDCKSVTIRFTVYDENKTLTKEEIDHVYSCALKALGKFNVTVR